MSTLQEIEAAIDKLPRDQVLALGEWIQQRIDQEWESQIENDVQTGRLETLANRALQEHRAGESSDFPADGK